MTYQLIPVNIGVYNDENNDLQNVSCPFPGSTRYILASIWINSEQFESFATVTSIGIVSTFSGGNGFGISFDVSGSGATFGINLGDLSKDSEVIFSPPSQYYGTWVNVLFSMDCVSNIIQCYINDVEQSVSDALWQSTSSLETSGANVTVSLGLSLSASGTETDLCVGDAWINPMPSFTDLTLSENRRKFIDASGTPIYLGANGELPTGSSPIVFLSVDPGGSPAAILNNKGTGGNFSLISGSAGPLIFCEGPPPPPPPPPLPALPQSLGRYRGQVGINWYGLTLIGDAFSGVIGSANFDSFTEYGNPMRALVTSPPIHKDRKRIFMPRFEIDVESGVGLIEGQGEDPQWMLDWSKDGGRTWSEVQVWRSMGRLGAYQKRLRWLRLGQSRQWVMRLQSTDPVRRVIIGAYVDIYEGMG